MSYNSLPADAVLSAFRSIMYISYCKNILDIFKLMNINIKTFDIYKLAVSYLYCEIRRVKGSCGYKPCFSRTRVFRDQFTSSFHQKLTVFLRRHIFYYTGNSGVTSSAAPSLHKWVSFFKRLVYLIIHLGGRGVTKYPLQHKNS